MSSQTEAQLEKQMMSQLAMQGYESIIIVDEASLEANFRVQIQKLNSEVLENKPLSDVEFNRILLHLKGKDVFRSANMLRDKYILEREDGKSVYLIFLDINNVHNNHFQVTNQITVDAKYTNRYDVSILVNGLPVVQIELKRRGGELKEAFNQVMRYHLHSFTGLFRFVQVFVISNGVETKYFANNSRDINFQQTFYWTDEKNVRLQELSEFSASFLKTDLLFNVLSRYMILNETDNALLVMRPYQVYAVEALVSQVQSSSSNAFIWHTTGSGKTLTSFKASQLISKIPDVKKVFFLVDRRDLDAQTISEFNKFVPDSVDRTDNTETLVDHINDPTRHLIVTTIQKMANAVKNNRYSHIMDQLKEERVVFIIDECHRSQFGDMHKFINSHFSKAQYFGFTGTPRFPENRSQDGRTTADLFETCLHTYLIKDAIKDGSVLGFSVETMKTFSGNYDEEDETMVSGIDYNEVFMNTERMSNVAYHIVQHHDTKTRNRQYTAIFTVPSIPALIEYYRLFKLHNDKDLKIAGIFTYTANEDPEGREEHSRDSLESMMKDYSDIFGTPFTTDNFSRYFTDVSRRVKSAEIDILLVVNMFLTGFDSKRLNTLYVDKNLKYHDLVQAYSRTNRVESAQKPYGQIVNYRNLRRQTDKAIRLFSQTDNTDVVLMDTLETYIKQWHEAIPILLELAPSPSACVDIIDEEDQLRFVKLFRKLANLLLRLETFIEFSFDEEIMGMTLQMYQDYRSHYYTLYENTKKEVGPKASILKDVDFVMEVMYRERINFHYILGLIGDIDTSSPGNTNYDIQNILDKIAKNEDPKLYKKIELIKTFLELVAPTVSANDSVMDLYTDYVQEHRNQALEDFSKRIGLPREKVDKYVEEFEYTGNIDIPMIDADLSSELEIGLLHRKKARQQITEFIFEHVDLYSY